MIAPGKNANKDRDQAIKIVVRVSYARSVARSVEDALMTMILKRPFLWICCARVAGLDYPNAPHAAGLAVADMLTTSLEHQREHFFVVIALGPLWTQAVQSFTLIPDTTFEALSHGFIVSIIMYSVGTDIDSLAGLLNIYLYIKQFCNWGKKGE
ncbi:hypothetical protein L7F22_005409 [Adiantum nelumboides]|nr:hypothetical protein [Adiantum nelumboides]